jgi:hypothetical protein
VSFIKLNHIFLFDYLHIPIHTHIPFHTHIHLHHYIHSPYILLNVHIEACICLRIEQNYIWELENASLRTTKTPADFDKYRH